MIFDIELVRKTIYFVIINFFIVLIFTWIWFRFIKKEKKSLNDFLGHVVFITFIILIYHYIFDFIWKYHTFPA